MRFNDLKRINDRRTGATVCRKERTGRKVIVLDTSHRT